MTAILSIDNANAYVQERLAPGCAIIASRAMKEDGVDMISVDFRFEGREWNAAVWIESGKLYGEW